jgi:hypothetical protein
MTSKKVGSPLASLFQQWSSSTSTSTTTTPPSYRIAFQTNYSMKIRCQAAESDVENIQVYRRAGLPTPKETAIRDISGSRAWLEHLAGLAQKAHCHVVFLQTRRTSTTTAHHQTIDLSKDPWGWDAADDDDADDSSPPSLSDLSKLSKFLQQKALQNHSSVVLIWDSLEPFFVVHGFVKTVRFLLTFQNCLQIWPVRVDTLTGSQHAMLEDASQALLRLQGGDMTMIRQGVREPGNIVRERLPFRLEGTKLVEQADKPTVQDETAVEAPPPKEMGNNNNAVKTTSSSSSSRPKIQLKMEEEEEKREPEPAANRPRIFLQEDDPEFDDLDEEDPDEDLDV